MSWAAAAALLLASCGGAAAPAGPLAASGTTSATPRPTASPVPTLNIFQLMGGAPATTVFALAGTRVRAVRLLDHFVKYEIAVQGNAQLLVGADGTRLFVADRSGSAVRLRAFDIAGGTELAAQSDAGAAATLVGGPGRGALAQDGDRILALKTDGSAFWVDAYDAGSLRPLQRRVVEAIPSSGQTACADRLLAAAGRVALICLRDGTATVAAGTGAAARLPLAPGELAGAAMLYDGSVVAVTPDGEVRLLAASAREAAAYAKAAGAGAVPRDGIAIAEEQVVVLRGGASPSVQIVPRGGGSRPLPIPAAPTGGLLASSPFAYFTSGGALYHVDLNTGNVERMTGGFEGDAVPAALLAR